MTDKEKLEEVKRRKEEVNSPGFFVTGEPLEWLIQQAERVQELESENRALRAVAKSNKIIGEKSLRENERYREVLKFYADINNHRERATQKNNKGNTLHFTFSIMQLDEGVKARKALEDSK